MKERNEKMKRKKDNNFTNKNKTKYHFVLEKKKKMMPPLFFAISCNARISFDFYSDDEREEKWIRRVFQKM